MHTLLKMHVYIKYNLLIIRCLKVLTTLNNYDNYIKCTYILNVTFKWFESVELQTITVTILKECTRYL